jgi:hypothetical protein
MLELSSEAEINAWAVRTFGGDRYRVVVWVVRELRRLRARVEELEASKGR